MGLSCPLLAGFVFGLFFDPEVGGSVFLRNVCGLLQDYMALHPARQQFFIVTIARILNPTCMYKGWAIKSSPCTATFNDLFCFKSHILLFHLYYFKFHNLINSYDCTGIHTTHAHSAIVCDY
jgi:hypothetical protein